MTKDGRRLMPYEHQLIEALGITQDEYLDFAAQQQLYSDAKEGTVFDIRNDVGVVALVLTIVGTILQVAAALLAKPEEAGRATNRDDFFAPRSGFGSTQELAQYGDPVNLVYADTSTNPRGGVRVNTSLLWSAIKSFGSSQYVQLLLLIGAGSIGEIDYDRTALGQTPVRDLVSQNYWLYFRPLSTGPIRKGNLENGSDSKDPGAIGTRSDNVYRVPDVPKTGQSSKVVDGFSHAISPSVSNRFGAYSPVPLNVVIETRLQSGNITSANNKIKVDKLDVWGEEAPNKTNNLIQRGDKLRVTLRRTDKKYNEQAEEEAAESRRALSSAFDNAGVMKLGSARFAIDSINNGSTEDGDMVVNLICTRGGRAPSIAYSATDPQGSAQKIANNDPEYKKLRRIVRELLDEDEREFVLASTTGVSKSNPAPLTLPDSTLTGTSPAAALLRDGRIFTGKTYTSFNSGNGRNTRVRFEYKRNLTKEEKDVLRDFIRYEADIANGSRGDDRLFVKALVKVEIAQYETITPCHMVDFAIKARVWRRISGRQEVYGSKQVSGYPSTDNGIKRRSAMYLVKYREANSGRNFSYVPGIFVVSRAADVDNFIYLRFDSGLTGVGNAKLWQFELEPVHDTIAEFSSRSQLVGSDGKYRFFYVENAGKGQRIELSDSSSILFTGNIKTSSNMLPPINKSPRETNEWDLFSNTADTQLQFSFDQGPEFTITAVTEQIREPFDYDFLYKRLSLLGFNLYSGRNVQDLRSMSVFVKKGRRTRLLRTSGTINGIAWGQPNFPYLTPSAEGHANTAPDIFIDTAYDKRDGIGHYVSGLFSVDLKQLAESKKFCVRNKLFMDGVIAEPTSWRQFWSENAAFSLLELAKINGREALVPAVPYVVSTGRIASRATGTPVAVTALFNQGNILEESYKEEFVDYGSSTEDVIVTAIYRDNERDGVFPRKGSVEVKLKDVDETSAIRETLDMSAFVSRREQAILVSKFLCQVRRWSRRAVEFKTFPTDSFVAPGAFIYVELAQNQWDRIRSGIIGPGGALNLPLSTGRRSGTFQFLLYSPNNQGAGTVFRQNVEVIDNVASALRGFEGYVFVMGLVVRNKRTFRVTEVAMDEDGEVTIRAIEHPVDADGFSRITHGLTTDEGLFTIDGSPE